MKISRALAALWVVEATSLPLLVLAAIFALTGYQLVHPSIALFPRASAIHGDPLLRTSLIVLGSLHAASGLVLICERRIRRRLLRDFLELASVATIFGLSSYLLALDAARLP
ncbi:MAG: hypothetical protein ABWK00_03740 [Desulfurococcaceae archaeon]